MGLEAARGVVEGVEERLKLVRVEAREVWERFEGVEGWISCEEVARYIFGSVEEESSFVCGLAAHRYLGLAGGYFEWTAHGGYSCREREAVRMEREWEEREAREREARERFIEEVRGRLEGREVEFAGGSAELLERLKRYALCEMGSVDGELGEKVLKRLGYRERSEGAHRLLVDLGVFSKCTNPHVQRYVWKLGYGEGEESGVEEELRGRERREEGERVDLSEFAAFAIDDSGAREVDDAISVVRDKRGRDWVYVHVVDVSFYVEANSVIDLGARERGITVYLPERHFGMLPSAFERRLSFGDGRRRALSFGALLNEAGEVEEWEVVRSYVGAVRRVTFEEVDEVMEAARGRRLLESRWSEELWELKRVNEHVFRRLLDFATKRRALRLNSRAAMLCLPDPMVRVERVGGDGVRAYVGLQRDWLMGARGMVTEFMLLAGELAARFAGARRIPFLYESQRLASGLASELASFFVYYRDLYEEGERSLSARWCGQLEQMRGVGTKVWSSEARRHEVHGLPCYAGVTSPLRRYTDLMMHYQIQASLSRRRLPFSSQELARVLPGVREVVSRAKQLARRGTRFWVLGCLEELSRRDGNRRYRAVVSSTRTGHKSEYAVRLMDFGIEEKMFCRRSLRLGQVLSVRVEVVNPFYDVLVLKAED
ncbi:uncharacterized ribonuclease sll1290-like [Schistocerca gregaria]|uniref:uncharacterized ribonuclease sll1290-like n=1 Tax=Schistocerca gregaria TaxID=7010 RepID=UPI00211E14C0|nr:uncharacterized ribonuclease sll1290-like [Schistocerca gregaria]